MVPIRSFEFCVCLVRAITIVVNRRIRKEAKKKKSKLEEEHVLIFAFSISIDFNFWLVFHVFDSFRVPPENASNTDTFVHPIIWFSVSFSLSLCCNERKWFKLVLLLLSIKANLLGKHFRTFVSSRSFFLQSTSSPAFALDLFLFLSFAANSNTHALVESLRCFQC